MNLTFIFIKYKFKCGEGNVRKYVRKIFSCECCTATVIKKWNISYSSSFQLQNVLLFFKNIASYSVFWNTSLKKRVLDVKWYASLVRVAINKKGRLIGSPESLPCVASALSSPADFARIKIRSTHPRDNQKAGVLRETIVTFGGSFADRAAGRRKRRRPRYSTVGHKLFERMAISRSASSDGRRFSVRDSAPCDRKSRFVAYLPHALLRDRRCLRYRCNSK